MKTIKTFTVKTKITSLILAFLIIFYLVPVSVLAEGIGTDTGGEESSPETSSAADYTIDKEVYEVTELREENVKHFRLEDGTYLAASYNNAVHYMDEHGEWQDIDNRLLSVGTDYSNGSERIKFTKKITGSGKIFSLTDGDGKLDMSVIGANKGIYGTVTNNEDSDEDTELQKKMNLENLSSSILYEEVFDGVDIEYVVHSLNVKENIIVKEKKETYSYSFELKLNKLTPEINSDGDVILYDEGGAVKYIIPAPIVYDAGDSVADSDVSYYTLVGSNNKYTLTVTVDAHWMNDELRTFPVTIDPTVTSAGENVYTDTDFVHSQLGYPYLSIVGDDPLHVKLNTLPEIDQPNLILSANISLTYNSSAGRFFPSVSVHEVLTDWDSDTFSATAFQAGTGAINASVLDYVTGANPKFQYTFDITSLVQEWYAGTKNNYGVAFKRMHTNSSGLGATGDILKPTIRFSRVSLAVETSPTVTISYFNGKGVEEYWSYSSQSAGVGGNVGVNLADGNMTLAIPTLSTTDAIMPYTPTLVYNSVLADTAYVYGNADTAFTASYTANGFKLNIGETVLKKTRTNSSGETEYYYIYADADGTEHYFSPQVKDGVTTYVDEDGLQLELTDNTNRVIITDTNTLWRREFTTVTAPDANVLGAWHLSKIVDNIGNTVVFDLDSSNRPTSVSFDPIGNNTAPIEMLTLSYYSTGMLKMVYNSASRDAVVFRYSSTYDGAIFASGTSYLRRIDYAHGNESVTDENWTAFADSPSSFTNITIDASALYTYNSSGLITKVEDTLSNQSLQYSWIAGKVSSVKHYAGTSLGQTVKYTYGTKYTDVTSSGADDVIDTNDDTVTRYVFDNFGRAVSVYSFAKNNSEIYGATVGVYETQDNVKNNLKEQTVLSGTSVNYLLNGGFEKQQGNIFTDWEPDGNAMSTTVTYPNSGVYGAYLRPLSANSTASISQSVNLEDGKYTLSFIYTSYNAKGTVATVEIRSTSGFCHSEVIPTEASATPTTSTFTTSFEITQGGKYTVKISMTRSDSASTSASLTIDQVMLEKRTGASRYSYVMDGGFESPSYVTGNTVILYSEYWEARYCTPEIVYTGELFGNSLKIPARTSESYVTQRVFSHLFSNLDIGNTGQYLVSGYAMSPSALNSSTGIFRLRVDVTYYQGNNEADVVKSFYYDFVPGCTDWQFAGGLVNTQYIPAVPDGNDYRYVTAIDVICEFSNQVSGYAYFDNISFVSVTEKDSLKYSYDESGRMVQKSTYFNNEYYFYNGTSRNPQRVANDDGEIWDYTYDNAGNVLTEKYYTFVRTSGGGTLYPNYEQIINPETGEPYIPEQIGEFNPENYMVKTGCYGTTYTYNTYGLNTSVKTSAINSEGGAVSGVKSMVSSKIYNTTAGSKIFGSLHCDESYDGISTYYYYDQNDGKLLATVNYNSMYGTAYTYDEMGNLIGATPAMYYSTSDYYTVGNAESVDYTYDSHNRLSTITTNSTTYTFTYDSFGNTTSVDAGDYELASYEYNQNNGKLKKLTYSNGLVVEYVYNALENLSEVWYTYTDGNGNVQRPLAYKYEYTADGKLHSLKNNLSGRTEIYKYDANGRLTAFREYENADLEFTQSTDYYYNEEGKLSGEWQYFRYRVNSGYSRNTLYYSYTYNSRGLLETYKISNSASGTVTYSYDALDRLSSKAFVSGSFNNTTSYTYYDKSSSTSPTQIKNYASTVNGTSTTYRFYYDGFGNIDTVIYSTGETVYYTYDKLGQLKREDNGLLGKTFVYSYDYAGNIIQKETFALTSSSTTPTNSIAPAITYVYTQNKNGTGTRSDSLKWVGEHEIKYDTVGNPIEYYNGASYTFTWQGRQLATAKKGGVTYSFTYSDEGIRTSKSTNVSTTNYYYSDGLLIGESNNTETILYIYDAEGAPIGMRYRKHTQASGTWTTYWFEKNLQGDIVAVYNSSGTKILSYKYDAWGNFTSTTHATDSIGGAAKNPFRYRGYYYDSDLGFYVTGTRYYDPAIGRFINVDGQLNISNLLGTNLYAYCYNNPVMFTDFAGQAPEWNKFLSGALLATMGVITVVAVVSTGGSCVPIVAAAYSVLATSGVVATAVGASEVYESFTGDNPIREYTGESTYDLLKYGSVTVMSMGSTILEYGTAFSVCFVAGTLVKAENGGVNIEDIQMGDLVYAHNPDTGATELKPVVRTFINETTELVHVHFDGEEIICTTKHPFYSPTKGWISAYKLRAGDILVTLNGEYIVVEQIQHEILESPIKVYNFEVADFHTYFVGSGDGVLVHNTCEGSSLRGVGGNGWVGDKTWRENVSTVSRGGTITSLTGGIPTKDQALRLINQSGGTALRIESEHQYPNPHNFPHINYVTATGIKGTIKIFE